MKLELTNEERETLNGILYFYRDDVSHGNKEGTCGLNPKSREFKRVTNLIRKIREVK